MTVVIPIIAAQTPDEVLEHVKSSGSSFLIGMLAVPKERRRAMFGLYAFCRAVDDIADSEQSDAVRLGLLQEWRVHVDALYEGRATHAIMELLLPGVSEYGIRKEDLIGVIEGMETDAMKIVFRPTWEELDTYCDRVASAVGRVSVCIYGENTEAGRTLAHHLGRALQLTNILRDIDEDAARGRVYLPLEALEEAGVDTDQLEEILLHPALDLACRAVARKAAQHFDEADIAFEQCDKTKVKSAALMRDYYERILYNLLQEGWSAPRLRVGLSIFEKLGLLIKAWLP
jgi:phytoene synthase